MRAISRNATNDVIDDVIDAVVNKSHPFSFCCSDASQAMADSRFACFKDRDRTCSEARRCDRQDDRVRLRRDKRGASVAHKRAEVDTARERALQNAEPAALSEPPLREAMAWDSLPRILKEGKPGCLSHREIDAVRLLLSDDPPDHAVQLLQGAGWIDAVAVDAAERVDCDRSVSLLAAVASLCSEMRGMAEAETAVLGGLIAAASRADVSDGVVARALYGVANYLSRRLALERVLPAFCNDFFAVLMRHLGASPHPAVIHEASLVVRQMMMTRFYCDGAKADVNVEHLLPVIAAVSDATKRCVPLLLSGSVNMRVAVLGLLDTLSIYACLETDVARTLKMIEPSLSVIAGAAEIGEAMELILPALQGVEAAITVMPSFCSTLVAVDGVVEAVIRTVDVSAFSESSALATVHILTEMVKCDGTMVFMVESGFEAAMSMWRVSVAVREGLLQMWSAAIVRMPNTFVMEVVAKGRIGTLACSQIETYETVEAAAMFLCDLDRTFERNRTHEDRHVRSIFDVLQECNGDLWISTVHRAWMRHPSLEPLSEALMRREEDDLLATSL